MTVSERLARLEAENNKRNTFTDFERQIGVVGFPFETLGERYNPFSLTKENLEIDAGLVSEAVSLIRKDKWKESAPYCNPPAIFIEHDHLYYDIDCVAKVKAPDRCRYLLQGKGRIKLCIYDVKKDLFQSRKAAAQEHFRGIMEKYASAVRANLCGSQRYAETSFAILFDDGALFRLLSWSNRDPADLLARFVKSVNDS